MANIFEWMRQSIFKHASDLHISVHSPPVIRVSGKLHIMDADPLQAQETECMVKDLLRDDQWEVLEENGELDFSFNLPDLSRFRVNAYRQHGDYSLAIRIIPEQVPSLESLGLPLKVRDFTDRRQGLLLASGPAGCGKSTTLAALIDYINQTCSRHIITLEDPVEYLHRHVRSVIDQRQIGTDTQSFDKGLKAVLRQDPDVILVGEMRDPETILSVLTAAETGHLVLASIHASDATQSIDRIIDAVPPLRQQQIRGQLAGALLAIVSQRLIEATDGHSRVAAAEVLVNTTAVANLIRTGKNHHLRSAMQTGKSNGMQTMEMSLRELLALNKISATQFETAMSEWVHG